ncbi:MAG: hypothetical protein ACR2K2_15350 [Mycobacteriales bacterium]
MSRSNTGPSGCASSAASVEQVVDGLRVNRLYVAPASAISPDRDAVLAALDEAEVPTYVVVVPQSDADAEELGIDGLLLRIVDRFAEREAVVLLVTDGQELQARDGGRAGADPTVALDRVLQARLDEPFTAATLTGAILEFTDRMSQGAGPVAGGTTRRTVGLVGLVSVAALGGGGWLYIRAQRRVLASAPLSAQSRAEQGTGWQGAPEPGKGSTGA